MSYTPTTDFIALLRQTSGGVRTERMPGLDYVIAALARASAFLLWVGETAPTSERGITLWLRPAAQSWAAESAIFLYNAATQEYEPATPALWSALLSAAPFATSFQLVTTDAAAVGNTTTLLAIERASPAATLLSLPSVAVRSRPLQIVDWSTDIAEHAITLDPAGTETIMRLVSYSIVSTADQRAGITLYPSIDLNGWIIAP